MNIKAKKWIEAAIKIKDDPSIKIKCPECNIGFLSVKDQIAKEQNSIDQYLICNHCGKWNVLTSVFSQSASADASDELSEGK